MASHYLWPRIVVATQALQPVGFSYVEARKDDRLKPVLPAAEPAPQNVLLNFARGSLGKFFKQNLSRRLEAGNPSAHEFDQLLFCGGHPLPQDDKCHGNFAPPFIWAPHHYRFQNRGMFGKGFFYLDRSDILSTGDDDV